MEVVCSTYLPPDLLIQILLRLDFETLSRFRFVSKSWYSLISEPFFRRSYECRKQNPRPVVITSSCSNPQCNRLHLYSLDTKQGTLVEITSFDVNLVHPHIEFSNLGLVCMYEYRSGSAYLCSPSTKELIRLSSPSEFIVAFGYVPSTDEYKALSISDKEPVVVQKTSIISIGMDRKWRPVGNPPFLVQVSRPLFNVALVDGVVHFLPKCSRQQGIARFDLKKEEWSALPPLPFLPPRINYLNWNLSLRELGGRLCLAVDRNIFEHILEIWLLKDYNNNIWVREYNIDVSPYIAFFYGASPFDNFEPVPLMIENDGRVLLQMTDSRLGGYDAVNILGFYDPRSGNFEDLNIQEKLSVATFNIGFFSQTFMSLIGLPEGLLKRKLLPRVINFNSDSSTSDI